MATQEDPDLPASQGHMKQFPLKKSKYYLSNSYTLGKQENTHIRTGPKGWDTLPLQTLLQHSAITVGGNPQLPPSFSLRSQVGNPHINRACMDETHKTTASKAAVINRHKHSPWPSPQGSGPRTLAAMPISQSFPERGLMCILQNLLPKGQTSDLAHIWGLGFSAVMRDACGISSAFSL